MKGFKTSKKERYQKLVDKHTSMLQSLYGEVADFSEREQAFFEAVELIKKFALVDSEHLVNDFIKQGKKQWDYKNTNGNEHNFTKLMMDEI